MCASSARAAAAKPVRQVLEWKTMPRYLKQTPYLGRVASPLITFAVGKHGKKPGPIGQGTK
jgi:hypothetical protein